MFTYTPVCHNQNPKSVNFRKQSQSAALRVLLNEALQSPKETLENVDVLKANKIRRFREHLFKPFSTRPIDHIDSDFLIFTLLLNLIIQDHSVKTFSDQNVTDAEKKLINVFAQIEFEISSETWII